MKPSPHPFLSLMPLVHAGLSPEDMGEGQEVGRAQAQEEGRVPGRQEEEEVRRRTEEVGRREEKRERGGEEERFSSMAVRPWGHRK